MTTTCKSRRIISNDDGWIITGRASLATSEAIKTLMADTYEGAAVDAVSWCVGDHEVYDYETEIGERFGEGHTHFESARDEWTHKSLNHLIETTGGPITEIGRQFRQAGIDFFPSVRMNSHYDIPYTSPRYGNFRRQHPYFLIGQPDEYIPIPTVEYAIRTGLDYKFPEVRFHMLSIICELFEGFDVDGVELDYMRHPAFFRPEEAYASRYLMTDFIRRIRQRLDEVGAEHGRHLDLLMRVTPTLYDCTRIGLDVRKWIGDGLVDIVAAGGGFIPFEMPIREFVEAAEGTDCQIYSSLEALHWALDVEVLRALAARFWAAGVDGIYLFNYFNTPKAWKRQVLGELINREDLPHLNKRYELDHTDRVASKDAHVGAFRYAIPHASLPVFMEETLPGGGSALTLDIADDVERARAEGTLARCVFGLGFDNFGKADALDVQLNGQVLPWESIRISGDGWSYLVFDGKIYHNTMSPEAVPGTRIEFDISAPPLKSGINELTVCFIKGDAPHLKTAVLKEVRLEIEYR